MKTANGFHHIIHTGFIGRRGSRPGRQGVMRRPPWKFSVVGFAKGAPLLSCCIAVLGKPRRASWMAASRWHGFWEPGSRVAGADLIPQGPPFPQVPPLWLRRCLARPTGMPRQVLGSLYMPKPGDTAYGPVCQHRALVHQIEALGTHHSQGLCSQPLHRRNSWKSTQLVGIHLCPQCCRVIL